MSGDTRAAWVAVLDALERDVAAVEAMLSAPHDIDERERVEPWQPPAGLGPLPSDLVPRAERLLARQTAVTRQLTRHMAANRQQSALVARLETGAVRGGPEYVDRTL
ncbi:MAG: hypothetical protein DIU79_02620 [Actinobacteria bacterium]|nr:MAG: hypothetical protein DIU79_02620 [Actinomycetota bacterium]